MEDPSNKRYITFLKPWGKRSWLVEYDGPYHNDRQPHVEIGEGHLESVQPGQRAYLSSLRKHGPAFMWTVNNVWNYQHNEPAHFTVGFGTVNNQKSLSDFR